MRGNSFHSQCQRGHGFITVHRPHGRASKQHVSLYRRALLTRCVQRYSFNLHRVSSQTAISCVSVRPPTRVQMARRDNERSACQVGRDEHSLARKGESRVLLLRNFGEVFLAAAAPLFQPCRNFLALISKKVYE